MENTTGKIDVAKDAAVKAQLMMIKTGIQAYIATNGAAPPDASQATLGGFVNPWPTNPFTNAPMKPGDGVGDYVYTPAPAARTPSREPLRREHVHGALIRGDPPSRGLRRRSAS